MINEEIVHKWFNHWIIKILGVFVASVAVVWAIIMALYVIPLERKVSTAETLLATEKESKKEFEESWKKAEKISIEANKKAEEINKKLEESVENATKGNAEVSHHTTVLQETIKTLELKTKERETALSLTENRLKEVEDKYNKNLSEIANISNKLTELSGDVISNTKEGNDNIVKLKDGINSLIAKIDETKKKLESEIIPNQVRQAADNTLGNFCGSDDFKVNVKTTQNDVGMDVEFAIDTKVNFKKGKYTIDQAFQKTCFIDAIGGFIKNVKEKTLEFSELEFNGKFEGGADSKIKSYTGKYEGEFNNIVVHNAVVNGETKNISMYQGDKIGNSDLAFLRAYSVYDSFKALAQSNAFAHKLIDGKFEFLANEYQDIGDDFRFGRIIVTIKKLDKQHEQVVIN